MGEAATFIQAQIGGVGGIQIGGCLIKIYRRQLREHPQASTVVDYLKGRGLSGEVARNFGLGFFSILLLNFSLIWPVVP